MAKKTKGAPKTDTTALATRETTVLTPDPALTMLRNQKDGERLDHIKIFIERGLENAQKLTVATTFNSVLVGLALGAAKAMVKHGMYEAWVTSEFPNFTMRQAQYYGKLATVFIKEQGGAIALPPPKEYGSFLMRAESEDSPVIVAVKNFVGDMTMAEVLDKYRIKPKKERGGVLPSNYMIGRYQAENPHLQNKTFDLWTEADRLAFFEWQKNELADDNSQNIIAAEGAWQNISKMLIEHGLKRGSYALLSKEQLQELAETISSVSKKIRAATK